MSKEDIQVGDLVSHPWAGVGLVMWSGTAKTPGVSHPKLPTPGWSAGKLIDVYWFRLGKVYYERRQEVIKLKARKENVDE